MTRTTLLILIFFAVSPTYCISKMYIGLRAGEVAMTGNAMSNYKNSIGYGVDIGFKGIARDVDLNLQSQVSPHSGPGDLKLQAHSVSFEFHPLDLTDLDVTLGIAPGLYFYKRDTGTQTRFGLNLGAVADLLVRDRVHLGFASRYHLLSESPVSGNFWTFMARVGYEFPI